MKTLFNSQLLQIALLVNSLVIQAYANGPDCVSVPNFGKKRGGGWGEGIAKHVP